MKVLLFTHKQDIDGIGCAVLAKEAFNDLDIVPCKTFEITDKVSEYLNNKSIYKYDVIFVTDLCIKEPLLGIIDKDIELRNKVFVIDHHKSEIDEGNDKYDFVNITVMLDGVKESGTSLFYKYLVDKNYLEKTSCLDTLVEWTRQYDVWDWERENNNNARYLHILFEVLGYEKYLEIACKFIEKGEVSFDKEELSVINEFENALKMDVEKIISNLKPVTLNINNNTYKIGYVRCLYKYRNDINKFVKMNNVYDVDTVGMIMDDIDTVSYRNVKDIDASVIAVYFGGKGHRSAASNPQDNSTFIKLVLEYNL